MRTAVSQVSSDSRYYEHSLYVQGVFFLYPNCKKSTKVPTNLFKKFTINIDVPTGGKWKMSENYNDLTTKVLSQLENNPEMITDLVTKNEENATRALMPGEDDAQTAMLKGILGADAAPEALAAVTQALSDNGVMQLMLKSAGTIDPKELLAYTGGFTSTERANPTNSAAVKALFDGKLDFKDILVLIALLKLFKGKQSNSSALGSGLSLLSSLMGGSNSSSTGALLNLLLGSMSGSSSGSTAGNLLGSLLGAAAPAQQQTTTQSSGGFLSSLLGGSKPEPQPQTTTQSSGGLLSALFGGSKPAASAQPQTTTANSGAIPFGAAASSNNNAAAAAALESFLNGNTGNNAQAQQLYSLLSNGSQSAFNSNGQINVGSLFNIASQLLGQ